MRMHLPLALFLVLGGSSLQAGPAIPRPHRASPGEVVAFMRKDLVTLPTGTRFKRVRWKPATREWEVTLEPRYLFDVWTVNATATDYSGMCFF